MNIPVLSICIPTRNRADILDKALKNITTDKCFLNTDKVEIIISDNCSDDNTEFICLKYQEQFPNKITYIRQIENIKDKNFVEILKLANGKYAKLSNDTLFYVNNSISKIVNFLEATDKDVVFMMNNPKYKEDLKIENFVNFNSFIDSITYNCTWIGGLCIKTETYKKLHNPDRFTHLKLAQIDIIARLSSENNCTLIAGDIFSVFQIQKKGGYNICEIFGKNFIIILNQLLKERLLTKQVFDKVIKKTLLEHINYYHFNHKNLFTFEKGGYFKYLFEYYKNKPYYYINYSDHLLYCIRKFFINVDKTPTHKKVKLFNLIKFSIKRKRAVKPIINQNSRDENSWEYRNSHNRTYLVNSFQSEKIKVGKATCGPINAVLSSDGPEQLIIGNFCSIAEGVKFIVASEHPYKGFSTYPFKVFYLGYELEAKSKGNIVVNDDVWIATNALILSGVTIGQGAIVGAGAVVTKDVPPYAIVGGNPATIIKYRFEQEIIDKLLKFDFSKLSEEKIRQMRVKLYTEITKDNIDNLLEELQS